MGRKNQNNIIYFIFILIVMITMNYTNNLNVAITITCSLIFISSIAFAIVEKIRGKSVKWIYTCISLLIASILVLIVVLERIDTNMSFILLAVAALQFCVCQIVTIHVFSKSNEKMKELKKYMPKLWLGTIVLVIVLIGLIIYR